MGSLRWSFPALIFQQNQMSNALGPAILVVNRFFELQQAQHHWRGIVLRAHAGIDRIVEKARALFFDQPSMNAAPPVGGNWTIGKQLRLAEKENEREASLTQHFELFTQHLLRRESATFERFRGLPLPGPHIAQFSSKTVLLRLCSLDPILLFDKPVAGVAESKVIPAVESDAFEASGSVNSPVGVINPTATPRLERSFLLRTTSIWPRNPVLQTVFSHFHQRIIGSESAHSQEEPDWNSAAQRPPSLSPGLLGLLQPITAPESGKRSGRKAHAPLKYCQSVRAPEKEAARQIGKAEVSQTKRLGAPASSAEAPHQFSTAKLTSKAILLEEDIQTICDRVYKTIEKKVRSERERRGFG